MRDQAPMTPDADCMDLNDGSAVSNRFRGIASHLTTQIAICLVMGVIVGLFINQTANGLPWAAQFFTIVTDTFLRLIGMIIAPLVFGTLVAGIAHMGDPKALGRIGARTLGWFVAASLLSLSLGMALVNILRPGDNLGLPLPAMDATVGVAKKPFTVHDLFIHIVPNSIVDAMASNEILQIVVFALFFGAALSAVGDRGEPIVRAVDALVAVMLKITDYVMRTAPLAVFAAVAHVVSMQGVGILAVYARFVGSFYFGLLCLWILLFVTARAVLGERATRLAVHIREPALLAFSTASSEAAYPRTLEALDRLGVPHRIASFVLPLGYSFNLDGSMMYMTFATIFIAQAYGIELSFGRQLTMLLTLMITSKGIAGVPRASLVVIGAVMGQFGIPAAGLLLVLAVDHFLDMGRSATNVIGNAIAASAIARFEGELKDSDNPPFASH